jgi:hypothetical protein
VGIDPARRVALAELRARISALDLPDYEMWLLYLQCGGSGAFLSFQAYLYGALDLADSDWAALQHSVWEAEDL